MYESIEALSTVWSLLNSYGRSHTCCQLEQRGWSSTSHTGGRGLWSGWPGSSVRHHCSARRGGGAQCLRTDQLSGLHRIPCWSETQVRKVTVIVYANNLLYANLSWLSPKFRIVPLNDEHIVPASGLWNNYTYNDLTASTAHVPCLQELKQLGVGCDILRCNKGVLNRRQTPFLQPYSEITGQDIMYNSLFQDTWCT